MDMPLKKKEANILGISISTGHCRLQVHLFRIGRAGTADCKTCREPETVERCVGYRPKNDHRLENVLTESQLLLPVAEYVIATGESG